jgi:hypothetical protein
MLKFEVVDEHGNRVIKESFRQMKLHIYYKDKLLTSMDLIVNDDSHIDIYFDGIIKLQKEI